MTLIILPSVALLTGTVMGDPALRTLFPPPDNPFSSIHSNRPNSPLPQMLRDLQHNPDRVIKNLH